MGSELTLPESSTFNRLWNRLVRRVESQDLVFAPPFRRFGKVISLKQEVNAGDISLVLAPPYPFEVIQNEPNISVPATDWRNIRIVRGTINTIHPDFDNSFDPAAVAVDILIPESQTNYMVWVECTIVITDGVTQGNVSTAVIKHGNDPTANGWADYPGQPDGNASTGQPANKFFVLLNNGITTTTDAGTKILFIPDPANVRASQWLDLVAFDMFCDAPNGEKLRRRMSRRSVP